ncbi:acyl carrier protein [Streptomyces sp. AcE210]|uniref:acyl carrier protein n=1 Tax=Streptomyces sp. AcE210 TaxID=2292703 RepID=UPI001F0C9AC0|nr:acyl carrier protein [Streptomyces sp. AcE210]
MDSLDLLSFVETLSRRTGIRIDDEDTLQFTAVREHRLSGRPLKVSVCRPQHTTEARRRLAPLWYRPAGRQQPACARRVMETTACHAFCALGVLP